MQPPNISTDTWWIIAAIGSAVFLATCVPLMPTRKYKIRVSCFPLLGASFLAAAANFRGHDLETLLSIYSLGVIVIPLGIVGRGKELKQAAEQAANSVGGQAPPAPFKLTAQFLAAALVGLLVWAWLRWG